jgi:hypothetical protein
MILVYRLRGVAQSCRMFEGQQPKRPWGGWIYLIMIVVATVGAYYMIIPMGEAVQSVFQRVADAFTNGR